MLGGFQGGDAVAGLLAAWGLDSGTLATLAVIVAMTVELLKKHTPMGGSWLLVGSLGAGLVWATLFFAPNWLMVCRTGVLVALSASGGFQLVKTVAGKVGEDNFNKAPTTLVDVKPGS